MSRLAQVPRLSTADRLAALEQRADGHDGMAAQVKEMHDFFSKAKLIIGAVNWFTVKLIAIVGGGLGLIAVVLTIVGNATKLIGGR